MLERRHDLLDRHEREVHGRPRRDEPTVAFVRDEHQRSRLCDGKVHSGDAEIAGFTHRVGDHKEDWLNGALVARFGKLGAGGPWVFISLKADTFLGYAKIELTGVKTGAP